MNYIITETRTDHVKRLLDTIRQLSEAHRKAKELYVDRFAPDFNFFELIAPSELTLSRVLAWFLDPQQTHGQGSRFLRLFFGALGLGVTTDDCDRAYVRTEVPITDGRLDILVRTKSLQLAVENKPWAGDQDSQLKRYFSHFEGSNHYYIVYLTPKGTAPSDRSIPPDDRETRTKEKQLYLLGYEKEILPWLAKCRSECRASRVSTIIDEFSRYIRAVFQGIEDEAMSDHLLDEITNSENNVSGAMDVIILADEIRKKLLSKLCQQIRDQLPGISVKAENDPSSKLFSITIASEKSPYTFCLEFQRAQFSDLNFGISDKRYDRQRLGEEYKLLKGRFGEPAFQNDLWLWGRTASTTDSLLEVSPNWSTSKEPWIEIVNGKLALKIKETFTVIQRVLGERGASELAF